MSLYSRLMAAVLVVTAVAVSGCGNVTDSPQYVEFATKRLEIQQGMNESAVRTILGVPSTTLTGSAHASACGASGSSSALVYEFVLANRLDKAWRKVMGPDPPMSVFTVCIDSSHKVTKTRSDVKL